MHITVYRLISLVCFFAAMTGFCASMLISIFGNNQTPEDIHLFAAIAAMGYTVFNTRTAGISFFFYFFSLFFVALPAKIQILMGVFPFNSNYNSSEIQMAFLLISVSMVAFMLVQGWRELRPVVPSIDRRRRSLDITEHAYFKRVMVFVLLVSIAIITTLGPGQIFITRTEFSALIEGSGGGFSQQLLNIGRSISFFNVILVLLAMKHKNYFNSVALSRLLLLSIVTVFFVLNYPPALSRFQLLGPIVGLCALYYNFYKPMNKVIATVAAAVFLFSLFPAIKALGSGASFAEISQTIFTVDISAYILRVDFDGFKQIADTAIYMDGGQFRWGANFLGALLFFVPRALWPGKPTDSGEIVSSHLGYTYTNVANPLQSEAYISFGFPGIVIVFGLLALFVSKYEGRLRERLFGNEFDPRIILYVMCISFSIIILRGSLNGVTPHFATAFLLYFMVMFWARMRFGR